jgi:hypothetical protein
MKIKIIWAFCIVEFVVIIFLLFAPKKPKYYDQFPGKMELSLQSVGEEAINLKTGLNGHIPDSLISAKSKTILKRYNVLEICCRDSSVYFLIHGGAIGGEFGLIYSKNGNPNWDGIKSMKRLSGGFYEYSSFY